MNKWARVLKYVVLAVVVVVVAVAAGGAFWLKVYVPRVVAPKSFPQTTGTLHLKGLRAPVDVYRDAMGVPSVYASNLHDLFFAQGYIHAQERFWQMDFWRHVGSGRLSEMFGKSQLATDEFLRTMGWREVAEQEYEQLSPQSKAILEAYTEGVNAYIADRQPTELSLEYLILKGILNRGYQIAPWTPVDSLVWGKAMAWDLRGNIGAEIERAVLLAHLTPEQVGTLFPPYPKDEPTIVTQPFSGASSGSEGSPPLAAARDLPASAWLTVADRFRAVDALIGETGMGVGSNSWVVSGALTDTGKPYLANDPHLGIQMPSIWFQMSLHCQPVNAACPFSVGGFSFAGVPGIVIGHNDRIAWGFTNVGPDVMDLFIEKVNPDNPMQYEYKGKWVNFETRQETINVAGGEPVTITVRISRHGPIISDTYGPLKDNIDPEKHPEATPFKDRAGISLPEHYAIALAWTALSPSTPFASIWGMDTAQNWEEFRAAALKFYVPAQNLVYADVDGNIGYQMPGLIPIRKAGDGRLPVPGWTGDYDWVGYVPFEELPYAFNPPEGYIVTANNRVPPWNYPYLITTDWTYGFRAERIIEMLKEAPGKIDKTTLESMQFDAYSTNAARQVHILLGLPMKDADLAAVRDRFLKNWDNRYDANSQSAAVFAYFWQNLLLDTFKDDLPKAYWPTGGERWMEVMRNLDDDPHNFFWDDKATPAVESRDDIFLRAWQETVAQMRAKYGQDMAKWPRWGDLHVAVFRNQTLGESGIGPIEAMFNRGPVRTTGSKGLVNATGWKVGHSFEVYWLPSMRMIVDLSNLDASLTVHTTGESGHAYHPHYDDMMTLWAGGKYYPMWWTRPAVEAHAADHLRLEP